MRIIYRERQNGRKKDRGVDRETLRMIDRERERAKQV